MDFTITDGCLHCEVTELTNAIKAIRTQSLPQNVTEICLCGEDDIGEMSATKIVKTFKKIPEQVIRIDLDAHGLYKQKGEKLARILSAILENVVSIDLFDNGLGHSKPQDLVQAFKALHPYVNEINLGNNELYRQSNAELAEIVGALPKSITSIDLSHNRLSGEKLTSIFQALPQQVNSMDLRSNLLGTRSVEELVSALDALPKRLVSIDLEDNLFYEKSRQELSQIFAALPQNVTSIRLHTFDFYPENPNTNVEEILALFPSNIKTVDFGKFKVVDIDAFWAAKLLSQLELVVSQKNILKSLYFQQIKLPFEIDEARLVQLVSGLEKRASPLAYLACGLLLEGHIENYVTEKDEGDMAEYMEKRTCDALKYYVEAARDPKLKPLVDFILKEMKNTSEYTSVNKRLREVDLSPESEDAYFYYFLRQPVQSQLPRDSLFFKPERYHHEQEGEINTYNMPKN